MLKMISLTMKKLFYESVSICVTANKRICHFQMDAEKKSFNGMYTISVLDGVSFRLFTAHLPQKCNCTKIQHSIPDVVVEPSKMKSSLKINGFSLPS